MTTTTITCATCGETFPWEVTRGARPKYCLTHGRRKVVLPPPVPPWDEQATRDALKQLVQMADQLKHEVSRKEEPDAEDTAYALRLTTLFDSRVSNALTLFIQQGRSIGASWATITQASGMGPWLARKQWASACPPPPQDEASAEEAAAARQPGQPEFSEAHRVLLNELNQHWERSGLAPQDLGVASAILSQVITDVMAGRRYVPAGSSARRP